MSPSCASTDKGVVRGWITTMMTLYHYITTQNSTKKNSKVCGHGGYDAFLFYAMSKYALDRQRYGRSIVMTTICVVGLVIHTGLVSRREIAFNNNNNKFMVVG